MADIHSLVRDADIEAVRRCLSADPDVVHARNDLDWTPLHVLATQGEDTLPAHALLAELLLEAGADIDARDMAGQTPLHLIAVNGSGESVPVARVILSHGPDIGARTNLDLDWHALWQHGREIRDLISSYERRDV